MTEQSLLAFAGLSLALAVTPGVNMGLVTRTASTEGRRATLGVILGIVSADPIFALVSGLSIAVLYTHAGFPAVLELGGALYLGYLAVRGLRYRSGALPARPLRSGLVRGWIVAVTNPKALAFYLLVPPAFIPPDAPVASSMALLMLVRMTVLASWFLALAGVIGGIATRYTMVVPWLARGSSAGLGIMAIALFADAVGLI